MVMANGRVKKEKEGGEIEKSNGLFGSGEVSR